MGRGERGIWKRAGRPNYHAWVNGKQVNLGTAEKAEALDKWHQLAGMARPHSSAPDETYVAELLDAFIVHLRDHEPHKFGWYKTRVQHFKNAIPEELALSALSPAHVTAWMRLHPRWSPTYAAGSIAAVQRALNWCVEQGRIAANPLARVRKPQRQRREFIYEPAQLDAVIRACPSIFGRIFYALVAASGCRPSEMAAAKGRDVASDGATISARQTKTGRPRAMPIPARLRGLAKRLAVRAGKGGLICAQRNGSPWNRMQWSRELLRAKARLRADGLDLPAEADAYAMRHTWGTRALEAGVSVADVALAMGNSIAMVSKVYAHLTHDRTRALADRLT